jgi:D-threo-aldose 1-dehydrogenase
VNRFEVLAASLPLVFGGGSIGGLYAPVSDEQAAQTLAAAWSAGIRAFDTAPHYGAGLSERRIGAFLATRPRDEFIVSTKVGRLLVPAAGDVEGVDGFYGTPPLARVRDYSRDGVLRSLEESLRRLGLDRVDIALIHDPDDFMAPALEGAYPALAELRSQGVITAIGAGMNSAAPLAWFVERCDFDCVLVAGRYTLLDDSAAHHLFPLCQQRNVAVLAGGPFNSGILADPTPATPTTVTTSATPGSASTAPGTSNTTTTNTNTILDTILDTTSTTPGTTSILGTTATATGTSTDGTSARFDYAPAPEAVLARVRRMRDICASYNVPLPAAALQFTLRHPAVTAAVVGARTPAEITADAEYLTRNIPDALFAALTSESPTHP